MLNLPKSLKGLSKYKQFLFWELREKSGKTTKVPLNIETLYPANPQQDSNLFTIKQVLDRNKKLNNIYGVAFYLTKKDPFFLLDIDHCLIEDKKHALNKDWSPLAKKLCKVFDGSCIEVSQSGESLHIIGSIKDKEILHTCKNLPLDIELYTEQRVVSLTGIKATGSVDFDCSHFFKGFVEKYFKLEVNINDSTWTDKPISIWTGPIEDKLLIAKAKRYKSKNISFKQLWQRDIKALCKAFPSQNDETGYDASSADSALAQRLCFWTGNNCERILILMQMCKLKRPKWDRKDYLKRTILNCVNRQKEVYSLKNNPDKKSTIDFESCFNEVKVAESREGIQHLDIDQQLKFFKGCTYISNSHKILTNSGEVLESKQFNVRYGGYTFDLDRGYSNCDTTKAWDAFTMSEGACFPKVRKSIFQPLKNPGEILYKDGISHVNTYFPLKISMKKGNVGLFIEHLEKLFPDDNDRHIIINYMCACVQHKGIKFDWAPVIQGVPGNGKTLLTNCIEFALGDLYVHYAKAIDLESPHNDWITNKLLIGLEDIYNAKHKQDVIENLKPLITGKKVHINAKHVNQQNVYICCNFMINSNYKDATLKTKDDRRFCPFFTPQQHVDDLYTDEMSPQYFKKLWDWINFDKGSEMIAEYLHNYHILDEYNPVTNLHRAPITTSTKEAIQYGLNFVQQEILEAIGQNRFGFRNGWISSSHLEDLFKSFSSKYYISQNKRRDLLNALPDSYDWHCALDKGRSSSVISIDGSKSKLFIRKDHEDGKLTNSRDAVEAYIKAQGVQ